MMKAVIFINGTYSDEHFYQQYLSDLGNEGPFDIICADGGANFLHQLERIPDVLIGDMDSVKPDFLEYCEKEGAAIFRYPTHKDETDTELAVNYCIQKKYSEVILFGATGTRMDHTLGNFYLLNKMMKTGIKAKAVDGINEIFLMEHFCQLQLPVNQTISIMAYTDTAEGIFLNGFEYPVQNGQMNHLLPGYGISNVVTEPVQTIEVKKGTLLIDIITE